MSEVKSVFVQIVEKPARKVIIKRRKTATEYFQYCEEAILQVWEAIKKYHPETIGCRWDDTNPRIQLEPRGERGYIEMRAVHSEWQDGYWACTMRLIQASCPSEW